MTPYPFIAALIGIALAAPRAEAQGPNEAEIKKHFEGKRVTLRIDMPGAADGVDIRVERLRRFGTSIRSGETATITTIKVKKDLVEFQLDGGGYGTFSDDTSLSVNMPNVQKSNRPAMNYLSGHCSAFGLQLTGGIVRCRPA